MIKNNKLLYVFLFFLILIISFSFLGKRKTSSLSFFSGEQKITEILSNIPLRDRERLEYFFRSLFVMDQFGYVLFDDKPISIGCFQRKIMNYHNDKKEFHWCYFFPYNLKMKKGYETWVKYQWLFHLKDYVIKAEENPWFPCYTNIILINKKLFKETVTNHIKDFEEVLGRKIDLEKLLQEVIKNYFLKDILALHDGLIGTILGYGRDNAWKFYKKHQIILKNQTQ